jgi:dethiobiotin synthetase
MSKQAFFITGTDTSVGKTVVTAALIKYWQKNGARVAGMKPIASGFDCIEGVYLNEDIESIKASSNVVLPGELLNRYSYVPAVAPHIIAQQHQDKIELDKIVGDAKRALSLVDTLIVEGVGGWLVPLNGYEQDYQDIQSLALQLNFPVILVVGMRLGCINHGLLAARSIIASGVPFAGWVANFCDRSFAFQEENMAMLDAQMPVPRLFEMPFVENSSEAPEIVSLSN